MTQHPDLESLPLPSLFSLVQTHGMTCRLRVADAFFSGAVHFDDGVITSAVFGHLTGDAAVAAILMTEEAQYTVEQEPARPSELESWAARASEVEALPQVARPTERPSLSLRGPEPALPSHGAIMSNSFGTEQQFPLIWVVVGLSALLLLGLMFWGTPAEHAIASKPVAPSSEPVLPPSLAKGTAPAAPPGALAPTVLVRAQIGQDGKIKQATAQSPRPGLGALEKLAADSVRSYVFRPATQGGSPVDYWVTIPVRFNPADGVRQLSVKGSDTIGATLGPSWARGTEAKQPGLKVMIEALGSSTGFMGLLDGTADVAASSRAVRAEELAFAARLGVQLSEVVAAYDGIAVIVHPDNPLRALDVETVARIFAQRVTRWSELAGADAPIRVLGRPSYSGTHSFLRERMLAVLGPGGTFGPSVESIEHSKDLVARVASDVHAIGYVSIGHLQPSVRVLALSARTADAPVAPTQDTIRDGSYPIARPLFLYLRADSGHDARLFVDHALSVEGQAAVARDGFVTLDSPIPSALALEIPAPHVPPPELRRIYFDRASAVIEAGSSADLAAAEAGVSAGKRALVIGHADSAGSVETNELLARQRAQAVASRLKQASRAAVVDVDVAAASHPLATNATADGRAANRRVDVILHGR